MKLAYKYTIFFYIFHIILNVLMIMIIFGWTAFGGSNSMNWIQKGITYFFTFPGLNLGLNENHFFIYLLLNALFWSVVFYGALVMFQTLRFKNKM